MNELLDNLKCEDESDRVYAVQDMAMSGNCDYVTPLIDQLQTDTSLFVKDTIVSALCSLDCSQAFQQLFSLLQLPDAYFNNHALKVFVSQNDNSVRYLTNQYDRSDCHVRKFILDILYEIGTPQAITAIRNYIHDTSYNVQITAIEYLGQLRDTVCLEDMITLLQISSEPMLCTAILSACININDKNAMARVLSILKEDESFANSNLYLPQVLRLSIIVGDRKEIITALLSVTDIYIYAEDIISAIEDAKHRFNRIVMEPKLRDLLFAIAKSEDVETEIRIHAADLLIPEADQSNMEEHYILRLGHLFLNNRDLQIAGVRLLAIDGSYDAMHSIQTVIKSTRDDVLRSLCLDIVSGDVPI